MGRGVFRGELDSRERLIYSFNNHGCGEHI
jgi:hypothetical protein